MHRSAHVILCSVYSTAIVVLASDHEGIVLCASGAPYIFVLDGVAFMCPAVCIDLFVGQPAVMHSALLVLSHKLQLAFHHGEEVLLAFLWLPSLC